jgi:hypothetical protein
MYFPNVATPFSRRGIPDLTVILPGGHTLFIEIKEAGDRLSAIQNFVISEINALGGKAWVADTENIEKIKEDLCRLAQSTSQTLSTPLKKNTEPEAGT